MKKLLILRHGKSDWSDAAAADHDRPLAKRGERDAPLVGEALARMKLVPDLIICSPAVRALDTARLVAERVGYPRKRIAVETRMYGGGCCRLLELLSGISPAIDRLLLVGHNPLLEELVAALLAGDGEHPGAKTPFVRIPTAGLVCLEFASANWNGRDEGRVDLKWMINPKILRSLL